MNKLRKTMAMGIVLAMVVAVFTALSMSTAAEECPTCGASVTYGQPVCDECGEVLEWEEEPEIGATVDIDPDILNLGSHGKWITARGELDTLAPVIFDEFFWSVGKAEFVREPAKAEIDNLWFELKIDRSEVEDLVIPGLNTIWISGRLEDGRLFAGCDMILVIDPAEIRNATADIDGDGEDEGVEEDPTRDPSQPITEDTDGDGDIDKVKIGTFGVMTRSPNTDIDGDGEEEIVQEDHERPPHQSYTMDLDGDGDPDVVVEGSKDGTRTDNTDIDGDGEPEMVVEEPGRDPSQPYTVDLDGDGDPDKIVVGTWEKCKRKNDKDRDGDGEPEIIIDDPNRPSHQEYHMDIDGDGDPDIYVR